MQSSTTSSLLLNSSSLKDLLNGVSDVRKRKIAIAKSEEMVGAILRKDAHDEEIAKKRQRARVAKKKSTKKRSLMDRTSTGGGLQRARQMRYASNNVFEYALDLGLDRDSVEHLERQYRSSRNTVKDCVEKVQLGFEQLNGPDAEAVAPSDADILLTLLGAELDNDAFLVDGTRFPNALPSTDGIQPMNIARDEQAEPIPPVNALPSAVVPIDHFTRGLENFLQQRVMLLTLGEIKGFASKNAVDRFLNRDHQPYGQRTVSQDGLENSLFGTSQLEVGGQMDNSLYDTAAPDALSHTAHLNDTSDLHAMFVSSVTTHRPNSQPEDFPHQSTMGSTAPRMRLENDANFYASQSEKDILPPLRLGRMLRKQRKDQGLSLGKKHFTKAGFDASFTRATPRVLQNKATVGKDFALGGGATEAEIEALRWELTVAREGIKHLDKMVDTNIAWVQSNCDMTGLAVNFSDRTKQKCRKMATERIVAVYVNLVENTQYWAMRRWQTAVRFDRLSATVKKYSKLKGIEILTNTLWKAITNQLYNRGWRPWLRFVQAQILAKMNKAAIQIQRIARGRQGRVRFEKKKLGQVAITLQKLFRKTKAVQVIKEKRFVREQELNNVAVRAIQKLLKKLINIRRAKAEANQRRMDRASIRIQKIHRGRQGRKDFLQKFLKKNHAEREDLDLELLAAAASKSASRDAGDARMGSSEQELALTPDVDTTHDPRKRSLFHKPHAPSSQMAASASPSTTSSAAATPRSKHAAATGKGQVDKNATPGSTRNAPSNLSQPKHRHESPNPVRASDRSDEKNHRSVRSGAPKATNKRSVRSPPRSPAPPSAPAPIDENKPSVLKNSTSRPSSKDSSPVPSRPPSGRASNAGFVSVDVKDAKDNSNKKLSSRPPSRADSPVNNALNASLLEYAHEEEESLAGDAILMEDDVSVASVTSVKTNQSTARAQSKPSKPSPSSEADNSVGARPRIRGGNPADNESTPPSNVRGAAGPRGGKTSTRVAAATSTKSSVRNPKSTRVAANVTPAAAAANIQKVARGKLARQLSKKLMEEKEVVPDESAAPADPQEATTEAAVPEQPAVDVPVEEKDPLQLDLTEQAGPTETPAHAEDANDGTASAAPDHTQDVYTDYGISASPSRDFSTTAGSRPSSRQSILSMLPTSILTGFQIPKFGSSVSPKDRPRSGSSFRFPGFSHKSDTESVGSANSVPPSPVNGDRPRSSTFFRNPFTGWSSRENTPSRTRPTGEGYESNSISFGHHPNVIREEVEEDTAKQEASVKKIQSRVRGIRDRKRVAAIKDEREAAAALEAVETAEIAAAAQVDLETELRPMETQAVKLKDKSATASGIASARMVDPKNAPAKPGSAAAGTRATGGLARRGSTNKSDSLTPTGRRASFDKEKEKEKEKDAPSRRRSIDKGNAQERTMSPRVRRASFDRDGSADERSKRRSFDKESERSGLYPSATKGSMDEKDKSVPRRSSFDRSGEKSAVRRASFDKTKDLTVVTALPVTSKPSPSATPRGGNTGSATSTARGRSATPEHHRRASAPVGMQNAAAAAAQSVTASSGETTPTPVAAETEASQPDDAEKDDYVSILPERLPPTAEFPDVPSESGTDNHSLPADDLSEADYSENSKPRGVGGSSEKKPPTGSSKKHKEELSRASKDKAAQKKKGAEDKRKADAAKAKAAREERSVHKTGAAAASNKPSVDAKNAKSAPSAGASATSTTPHKKPELQSSGSAENKKALTPLEITKEPTNDASRAPLRKGPTAPVMPSLEEVNSGTYSHSVTPKGSVTPKSGPSTPKPAKKAPTPKFRTRQNLDPTQAASIIQNRARVKLSQSRIQKKKEEIISAQKKLGMLIHWAVVTIQRNFRGRKGRKQFVQHAVAKQVALAQQQAISAQKLQAIARGKISRNRVKNLQEKKRKESKERQEQAWVESYYKGSRKVPKGDGVSKPSRSSKSSRLNHKPEPPSPEAPPNAAAAAFTAQQTEEMDAKIRELKEIQRSIQEQQEKMAEYARLTEANAAKMQQAVQDMEEKAKHQEAERLLQQQLFAMAAGPLSHRDDYASPMSTQQRRGGSTARQIVPNSARVPDVPPTARSARGGAAIPPDAPQMYHNNDLWVQLWDPDQNAYYWYCERTQISQWDAPGTMRHMGTGNSGHNATMPLASSRRSVPNSARIPNAPPTARSARNTEGSTSIPPDAPQMTYNGEIWVQLWDSDESAYYWYCERTGFAQWEAPGSAGNQSTATMVANYNSDGADSGYESAGAMTDYSTDHYEEHSAYTSDSEYENSVWQEFWDESAQAKYWYNNNTGEASWTRPETAASSHGSEEVPLAITNGLDNNDAASGANEWVSYIDEDTEQAYWYNVRTGETSWA